MGGRRRRRRRRRQARGREDEARDKDDELPSLCDQPLFPASTRAATGMARSPDANTKRARHDGRRLAVCEGRRRAVCEGRQRAVGEGRQALGMRYRVMRARKRIGAPLGSRRGPVKEEGGSALASTAGVKNRARAVPVAGFFDGMNPCGGKRVSCFHACCPPGPLSLLRRAGHSIPPSKIRDYLSLNTRLPNPQHAIT